jgi:hypothetical protein
MYRLQPEKKAFATRAVSTITMLNTCNFRCLVIFMIAGIFLKTLKGRHYCGPGFGKG